MTEILLTALLVNTLAAALLGGLALLAWRRFRRPLIAHALVVVALLKLVTPPMWGPVVFESEAVGPADDTAPRIVDLASLRALQLDTDAATAEASFLADLDPWRIALAVWLLGSALAVAIMWRRHRRFTALLRRLDPAPRAVETLAAPLAHELGLRTTPLLRIADSAMQPFLFALGSAPTIVLPRAAVEDLDPQGLRALLAHELAHLRNRDHWTRALELAVAATHWWNPIAHLLRSLLREVEEVRCDARAVAVLGQSPDRLGPKRYGRALLDATELLEARAKQLGQGSFAAPLGATALSDAGTLRRRITALATGTLPCRLGSMSRASLLLAAGSTLPFGLMGAAPEQEPREAADRRILVVALDGEEVEVEVDQPAETDTAGRPRTRILRWNMARPGDETTDDLAIALPELLAKLDIAPGERLRTLDERRLLVRRADGSSVLDASDGLGHGIHVVLPEHGIGLESLAGLAELHALEDLAVDVDVDVDVDLEALGDRLRNARVKVAFAVPDGDGFAAFVGDALAGQFAGARFAAVERESAERENVEFEGVRFEDVELQFRAEADASNPEDHPRTSTFRVRSMIRQADAGEVRSY